MKALIKISKTKTYIKFSGEFFMTSNDGQNKDVTPVNFSLINGQQAALLNSNSGWQDIGEYTNLQSVCQAFIDMEIIRRSEGKAKSDKLQTQYNAERIAAWEAIKDLEVIPSTIENIRSVLLHLNTINWGVWKLPKMAISYSAAQFDCDGSRASTMKLDKAVEGSKMFKVGGKHGHLSKYTHI